MDKPIPSPLDRVIEEMRTIGMVAGQCSVGMAAAESDRCLRWADALSEIRDALAAAQQEKGRSLTHELLDLITLMPDSQTDEIAVYIIELRRTRKRSCEAIRAALFAPDAAQK